jgi:hypothetical protein
MQLNSDEMAKFRRAVNILLEQNPARIDALADYAFISFTALKEILQLSKQIESEVGGQIQNHATTALEHVPLWLRKSAGGDDE